jgi:glycosyltransferase involved in cell wall biosynthesis
MKVLILQDHLRGGGTERQSVKLTKALLQAGTHAKLLVAYPGGQLDTLAQEELGEHLHFLSSSQTLHSLKALLNLSKNFPGTPHVLLCMGRWSHSVVALIPKPKNQIRVSTVRTSRPLNYLYRKTLLNSDHLITNSQWALDSTRRQCPSRSLPTATTIHNALSRPDLITITPEDKALARSQLQVPASAHILLSVARLEPGKGQADLIHALALLKASSLQLWLAGEGPLKTKLQSLAQKLKVDRQVRFLGFQKNLTDSFAAADTFVSASRLDSLPNALLEAQAAALPVVAYPSNGIPEIVIPQKTGLLTLANTPEALAQSIQELLDDPEKARTMGLNGRIKVTQAFDPDQQNALFSQTLQKLLSTHA